MYTHAHTQFIQLTVLLGAESLFIHKYLLNRILLDYRYLIWVLKLTTCLKKTNNNSVCLCISEYLSQCLNVCVCWCEYMQVCIWVCVCVSVCVHIYFGQRKQASVDKK